MKLLRLCEYFAPEKTAARHLVDDMYEAYTAAGINCVCVTPEPSRGVSDEVRKEYKKRRIESLYNGMLTVKRFPMMREGRNPVQRALRYFWCAIKTYQYAIKEKDVDVVFVSSTPPIMGALGAKVAKKLSNRYGRKVPMVYNLQDIFPDSLVSANIAKKGSFLWKVGRKLENYTYRSADEIIVISEGFKKNIMRKGVPESKITVISNWIDMDSVHPVAKEDNKLFEEFHLNRDKFNVVYAGNLGEVQGAEIILDAAERLKENSDIQFAIFGGGSHFEVARTRAANMENVMINPLLPLERVSEVYSLGDVALITCKPGSGGCAMPSKTWSIMACNTPIIASFDMDSDMAEVLNASKAGACVEAGNAPALANEILQAYENRDNKKQLCFRSYVEENTSKEKCLLKYINIITGVIE